MDFSKQLEQEALIKSLKELICIPSVGEEGGGGFPFGTGPHDCLNYCLKLSSEMGFKAVNIDNMLGFCEYGSGEEMIAVLGHLDVVPEGEGWSYPPYGGVIENGKIYGRGAIDDKGPLMASLYALKALKDSGIPLKKRIRVFFGLNEETGSADMKYYLEHKGEIPVMGFTPDGEYPIINGEKGIVNAVYRTELRSQGKKRLREIEGGTAVNVVPDFARAKLDFPEDEKKKWLKRTGEKVKITEIPGGLGIEAIGMGAHGSTPEQGENAIGRLLNLLEEMGISGELGSGISFLSQAIGMECDGKSLGIASEDSLSGKLTFNLGCIKGGENGIELKINLRYPVTDSYEQCVPVLQEKMKASGFSETALLHKKSIYMPPDSELIEKLSRVYERQTGDKAKLKSIGGGTYAKAIPNIVAFGPVFPGDIICEHRPDEYIELSKLIKNAQIIADAMYELAK